ncbi:hypothetical protein GC175_12050 [bacterium]|nr:hypothetical protein [bacterium]
MLTIKTLGQLDILLDGESHFDRIGIKGALLLIYLVEEKTHKEIPYLAHLLWPTIDPDVANLRLRSLLTRMRKEGFERYLDFTGVHVRPTPTGIDYDADRLRRLTEDLEHADPDTLMMAANLYVGPFLQRTPLDDYLSLAAWAHEITTELRQRATAAFALLVQQMMAEGSVDGGLDQAAHLATLHPYDDASQSIYIFSLVTAEHPQAALNHYQNYRRHLREDRGITRVDPLLSELISQIESLVNTEQHSAAPDEDYCTNQNYTPKSDSEFGTRVKKLYSLQQEQPLHTPQILFGRQSETEQLNQYLDEGHRLISVIGLGGTGKTFFVRSHMKTLKERFNNNVYFVDLRSAESSVELAEDAVLRAVRASLALPLPAKETIFSQIVHKLQVTPHCLILDNFETVIDAAMLLIHFIQAVPHLTIIVTTRTALYLSNESRLHLAGLAVEDRRLRPRGADGVDSEAMGFFVYCVRRFRPDFTPDAMNMQDIRAICRLVAGVPLAIELATLQMDVFSLPELRARLGQDIGFLTSGTDNLPGNHHSMKALLDGMWQSLNNQEQQTLAMLSVFANSWHRDAMQDVAATPRSVFNSLLNTAMLQVDEPSWFSMHPLIKQYAAKRLHSDFNAEEASRRHAFHFLNLLDLGEQPLDWAKCHNPSVLKMLQQRIYDLEISWQWAIVHNEWSLLTKAIVSFTHLHILSGHSQSGRRLLSELLNGLPAESERTPQQIQLAGRAALFLSYLGILQGDINASKPWAEPALAWLDAAGTAYDQAVVRFHFLWRALQFAEEMDFAFSMVPKALELTTEHGYVLLKSRILLMTALIQHMPAGEWAKAEANAREALTAIVEAPPFIKDILVNAASIFCSCLYMRDAALLLDNSSELILSEPKNEPVQYYDTGTILSRYLHATLLADRGALHAAADQMIETLPLYLDYYVGQASLAYGFLALCQARLGDLPVAIETARTGLKHSETLGGRYFIGYAKLRLAEVLTLSGKGNEAIPHLQAALSVGFEIGETTLVFSSLYGIALLHKDTLPRDLYERILKIGVASPAMYHEMHPITRAFLHTEGIVLTEEERLDLYRTDLTAAKELMTLMTKVDVIAKAPLGNSETI